MIRVHRAAVVLVLVAALVGAAPAATATDVPVSGVGPVTSPSGPSITFDAGQNTTVNFDDLFPTSDEVRLNTSAGIVEFRSNGRTNATITAANISDSDWTNVTALDVDTTNLTVDPDEQPQFTVGQQADRVSIRNSLTVGDGTPDLEYAGSSGQTLLILNDLPINAEITAIDDDTGEVLGGASTDSVGTGVFELDNSEHTVRLTSNDNAPTLDDTSASPQGNPTTRYDNETLSIDVDDGDFPDDEVTVDFYVNNTHVGNQTLTSPGTASVQVGGLSEGTHDWYAVAEDAAGQTDTSSTFQFTVDHYDTQFEDPTPQGMLDYSPSTLEVNLSDADFANDGDQLSVTFYQDGQQVGTDTLNANGTVSTSISAPTGGSHDVRVNVTDQWGQEVSYTWSYSVPDTLLIYEEINPDTRLDTVTTEVSFIGEEEVYTRTTSNGEINMTGLPVNEEFVVSASADDPDFEDRRIHISSIYDQQEIYLLNSSAVSAHDIVLNVEDETGQFPTDDTVLEISKPLSKDYNGNGNTTTKYQVISGDQLDAAGEFPATLESGERYRIRVFNSNGDTRELGAIIPRRDRQYNLRIQGLTANASETEDGWTINTSQNITGEGANRMKAVEFEYHDPQRQATQIELVVHEAGNASNVYDTTTLTDDSGIESYAYTQVFHNEPANTSLVANYTIVRSGENITGTTSFGAEDYAVATDLSPDWGAIFGVGFLIVLAGLFSIGNARIGALIIPGAAMTLHLTGIIDAVVSVAAIGLAFAVAVVINIMQTSGDVLRQ